MADKIFISGFYIKESDKDWILCKLGINIEQFSKFVKEHKDGEFMNIDICESKKGKMYAQLNTYKKEETKKEEKSEDRIGGEDLPF